MTNRERRPQEAYSDQQALMLDEQHRRTKAGKIIAVLHQHLGVQRLDGLTALDLGCSAGFIADELASDGATVTGVDIDEPGLAAARARFGDRVQFVQAPGENMPLADESVDVVVFNHIYEHVVDPDAVITEIHRVLGQNGVAYLGLGNKYQLIEPHYRLPFLSWLPQSLADRYIRRAGKAETYYESYRSRRGLKDLVRGFNVWDYTIPVIQHPGLFGSQDQVNGMMSRVPAGIVTLATPIIPTYIWVVTKGDSRPGGVSKSIRHLDLRDRHR